MTAKTQGVMDRIAQTNWAKTFAESKVADGVIRLVEGVAAIAALMAGKQTRKTTEQTDEPSGQHATTTHR